MIRRLLFGATGFGVTVWEVLVIFLLGTLFSTK